MGSGRYGQVYLGDYRDDHVMVMWLPHVMVVHVTLTKPLNPTMTVYT